tara:strand:- start:5193 stop:5648 length:456 start_codon:yes stop_codon:yes gene_type:complete
MCGGGGGGGGDSDTSTRPGEEGFNPNAPSGKQGGEAQTYSSAMSTVGSFLGDNRSDQQIADDQAVTNALTSGSSTFTNALGQVQSVAGYERDFAPSTGFLAALNSPPTVGGFAGFGASSLIGGPLGFVVGQGVRMGVNSLLGDRATLGGRR